MRLLPVGHRTRRARLWVSSYSIALASVHAPASPAGAGSGAAAFKLHDASTSACFSCATSMCAECCFNTVGDAPRAGRLLIADI